MHVIWASTLLQDPQVRSCGTDDDGILEFGGPSRRFSNFGATDLLLPLLQNTLREGLEANATTCTLATPVMGFGSIWTRRHWLRRGSSAFWTLKPPGCRTCQEPT